LIGKDPLRSLSLTSPEVEDLDYEELFYNTIKSCIPQLKNKSAKNSLPDNGEAKGLSRTPFTTCYVISASLLNRNKWCCSTTTA
jgi:hypothetical protein